MTAPTDEAMTRPLFEEPTFDIARADEWSEPLGFLFAPMFDTSDLELSRQFFDAANLIVEAIRRREHEDYKLTFPVLFLYRHALELVLKAAIGGAPDGHRLDVLGDQFAKRCEDQSGEKVPTWITRRLREIADIDPNSTAFRYAENGPRRSRVALDIELHVNLHHLQRAMQALYSVLADVVGKLDKPAER